MFCNDPGPSWATSPCVEDAGHGPERNHRDRDGRAWFISESTIQEARRIQERADERSRQDLLRQDLRLKYILPDVPESVADKVFDFAWEHGHSAGNHEVEMFYEGMKDAVNSAWRAGRVHGEAHPRPTLTRTPGSFL